MRFRRSPGRKTIPGYRGMTALPIVGPVTEDKPRWLRREECPGCVASKAADERAQHGWAPGRWPIGYCGPSCLRRLERDYWLGREHR